ncbi:MAG TPA: hypothetical protein VKE51_25800 [Vicinamibacterales bacterium]|nr:hypothetical protein [Vicinamibacterales bacterium]
MSAEKNSLTSGIVDLATDASLAPLWWALAALAAAVVVILLWIWLKGRPFAEGDVFRASRWSSGNRLFPTQVLINATTVVHHTPRWIGKREETIHMAHIASVKIETGVLLSDVLVETSGGSDPIVCHGHRKGDATRMKALIERYQTAYYRSPTSRPVGGDTSSR